MINTLNNRHGLTYWFEKISNNTYTIKGELNYWRFGGREGQQQMDMEDLGFVDPSGGPFISLGMKIHGSEIVKISASGDYDAVPCIIFEVV